MWINTFDILRLSCIINCISFETFVKYGLVSQASVSNLGKSRPMVAEIFHLQPQWDNNFKIHEIKKIYESILNKYILILLWTGLNDKSVNRTNKHTWKIIMCLSKSWPSSPLSSDKAFVQKSFFYFHGLQFLDNDMWRTS